MDILPIQAFSVSCKRVFSSSKETITARRNSLSPQLVEALQLLKFSTKQSRGMNFTQGWKKEDEIANLVRREEEQPVEDLCTFLNNL
jgi:hypothetical protein